MTSMANCIPRKVVPVKNRTPWINRDLIKLIKKREHLYHRFKTSKCRNWLVKYKSLRNNIVSLLREAKSSFFSNLAKTRVDPKKFWAIIRSLKPPVVSSEVLTNGYTTASTNSEKANMLNNFFLHAIILF